jgi:phosphohistidine phosphatase
LPRELLILRHAKSSWDSGAASDFERPLSPRGIRNANRLATYLLEQGLHPGLTVSSAAARAQETTELALSQFPRARIEIRDSLYHAGLATLVNTIREQDNTLERLMLVGHNPGMDQLLVYLCKEELSLTSSGKLMTTAALARIVCRCSWAELAPESCNLESLLRPSDFQR